MNIFKLSQIGEIHVNDNEYYLIFERLGKNSLLYAVTDGCSSGTDSHIASSLIGKKIRKLANQ